MFIHLGGLQNFTLQKEDDLLDVSLTNQVSDKIEHLLIDFERNGGIVTDDCQDVVDVVLEDLGVVLAELKDFLENDDLDVVVIILLEKVQITLNGNFDGARCCGELSDCVGALEEDRWTLGGAHHEDGVHQARFLAWIGLADITKHLKNGQLEDITDFRNWIVTLHQIFEVI